MVGIHTALRRAASKIGAAALLAVVVALSVRAGAGSPQVSRVDVPLGLPPLPAGVDTGVERVALGRKLFFDRGLAFNGTLSCAMCHVPGEAFASNQTATSVGIEGQTVRRNAPTLLNVVYRTHLFHDGRESSLATQAWGPLLNPLEMGNPSIGYVLDKLAGDGGYQQMFRSAFPGRGISMETLGAAIAAFEATLLDADTRFDRWRFGGDENALSGLEREGFALFTGKAGCAQCHTIGAKSALFSDQRFHNTGIGYARTVQQPGTVTFEVVPGSTASLSASAFAAISAPTAPDLGRFEITLDPADRWAYLTPTLRAISRTMPYMHDGSLSSLAEVVEFYDRGGIDNPDKSPRLHPLHLTAHEKAALIAFLKAL
jgi:cytochrome c peroxidase